jgi:hypothetical protein
MNPDFDILISLASIAGVFIGFAALITASKDDSIPIILKGIVNIGLLTLVGALLPILIGKYGIEGNYLWQLSSGIFLLLIWFGILHPTSRPFLIAQFRLDIKAALFFWIFIEIPIQAPLFLSIFDVYPSLHVAFYITSIILNLVQAGILLVQYVHSTKSK